MSAGISRRMIFANRVSVMAGIRDRDAGRLAAWIGSGKSLPIPEAIPASKHLSSTERVRERAAVDELEFATERDAMGQTTRAHAGRARELGKHVRGGLALDSRI